MHVIGRLSLAKKWTHSRIAYHMAGAAGSNWIDEDRALRLANFNRAFDPAQRIAGALVDIVLPRRCLACGEFVNASNGLCPDCWSQLRFLHFAPETETPTSQPINGLDGSRSALLYDDASRHLILNFKHGGRIEGVSMFARWMAEAGAEILAEADLILPVPLHRWRLMRRGFNQCSLLARAIAKISGIPAPARLLIRQQRTKSQQGLNARARRSNIKAAAFTLARRRAHLVRNARIVLVDDVMTTGATLQACAEVLKEHGALSVTALTLARTSPATDMS